ncbi:MAG: hypothetical protein ACRC9V_01895 [Aeromonas sp.]
MKHTRVSFVLGHHHERACVRYCQYGDATGSTAGNTTLLVTDLTPFHPQSHLWPDQPGDSGHVSWAESSAAVGPCQMGAISPEGELFVDRAIPVKRGADGWAFVVVHPLIGTPPLAVGTHVELHVDPQRRAALSRSHSASHLIALALNRALLPYWRKEVTERDALGQPDFDRLAIQTSRLSTTGSCEQYRLGKSVRKKGVNSEALLEELETIAHHVNQQLANWLTQGGDIHCSRAGEAIIDSRYWHCTLEGRDLTMPCGGTHVANLTAMGQICVTLTPSDEGFTLHHHHIEPEYRA